MNNEENENETIKIIYINWDQLLILILELLIIYLYLRKFYINYLNNEELGICCINGICNNDTSKTKCNDEIKYFNDEIIYIMARYKDNNEIGIIIDNKICYNKYNNNCKWMNLKSYLINKYDKLMKDEKELCKL